MISFLATASLLLFASKINARPNLIAVESFAGRVETDSYIVQLKSGADARQLLSSSGSRLATSPEYSSITHVFNSSTFNGFAGKFKGEALLALQSSKDVEGIYENGFVDARAITTQTDATWGLARLSSKSALGSSNTGAAYPFKYDTSAGAGVDIYIVDTGIYLQHSDFGGRAIWGATFGGYPNADGQGHGTSCAGVAGGNTYGVAKKAALVAVKVLSDSGSGTTADIISGLQWIIARRQSTGRPSVAILALGGSANTALDNAVVSAHNAGVHVVVASGASNTGVENTSPARVTQVITVGATTIADAKAPFSNYGPGIDIFAPGVNIKTTWIGSPTATITLSGTSYSACYVGGLIAYFLGLDPSLTPAAAQAQLHTLGVDGILTSIPSGTNNEIAYNGAA